MSDELFKMAQSKAIELGAYQAHTRLAVDILNYALSQTKEYAVINAIGEAIEILERKKPSSLEELNLKDKK